MPLLAVCVVTASCVAALRAPIVVDGRDFPRRRVSDLRAGMPSEEVQAILGAPLTQAQRGKLRVWIYDMRRQRRECQLLLFGFVPLQRAQTDRYTLELTFDRAGLERAVYLERMPERDVLRTLVHGPSP